MVEGEGFVVVAAAVGAPVANGGPRPPMRWSAANSGFVLRAICELVGKGARTDKGFKEVHVNQVAKALREFSGDEDHPKDAEYLNRPIEFYTEMETAFGSTMATRRFAMGSGEALGQFSGFNDSEGTKPEIGDIGGHNKAEAADTSKTTTKANTGNSVAAALREIDPSYVDLDLYDVVMGVPKFNEEALMVAYSHLLDNKAQGRGYINMTSAHRVLLT
ncbi:hypothetical protein PR202_ga20788 [Eleusine coracana subsp. coracana]|uniref:Uncharacterized protein n=1 Tax=Eleusine coracana subsp. coracana TaxID=191504 RepID=A0AAV5CZQ1_ELECO|nr:hypothetical protein PR202_ga20788 [Eleusine coracana subsp. coracana]